MLSLALTRVGTGCRYRPINHLRMPRGGDLGLCDGDDTAHRAGLTIGQTGNSTGRILPPDGRIGMPLGGDAGLLHRDHAAY